MASMQCEQVQKLREIFDRFDIDSDGSITQLELAALLRSLGIKHTGDQICALLANMDANRNGYIEFDELATALLPEINHKDILVNENQLLEFFQSFDRDGNGYITAAELAGSMAKIGQPLTYEELAKMMKDADTNGDGVISFKEFTTIMGKSAAELFGINNNNANTSPTPNS